MGRPQNLVSTGSESDVANVFRIGRRESGGISWSSEIAMGVAAGLDRNLLRLAVEVAGRDVPVLALALVHVQLDDLAIGAMKGLVAM